MKKPLAALVVLGLLSAPLIAPAEAKKKGKKPKRVERKAEGTYDNPAIGIPGVVGSGAAGGSFEFPLAKGETFIDVKITDDGGGPVVATMSQNTDPADDSYEIFATFCGETEEPLQIAPGLAVRVSVYTTPGPDQPSCVGLATSGTITATLSNLP